jgi:BTB/POZ domain
LAEDGRVKAHSVVLAASSAMFNVAFKSSQKPAEHIIVLPGLELWVLETVVHYMYSGSLRVPGDCTTAAHLSRLVKILTEFGFNIPDDWAVETRYAFYRVTNE